MLMPAIANDGAGRIDTQIRHITLQWRYMVTTVPQITGNSVLCFTGLDEGSYVEMFPFDDVITSRGSAEGTPVIRLER